MWKTITTKRYVKNIGNTKIVLIWQHFLKTAVIVLEKYGTMYTLGTKFTFFHFPKLSNIWGGSRVSRLVHTLGTQTVINWPNLFPSEAGKLTKTISHVKKDFRAETCQ